MRGVRPASIDWIVPPAVRPGDAVGVCAPSGPIRPARFDRGMALLAPHLRLRVGDDLRAERGYLAGDDRRRADELGRLIRDPDVRAILVARGGYGVTRILADVDPAWLRADPKPIVAFSDGTALLAWAAASGGARGRRRGAATGRFEAWWVLATLTAQDDDWPVDPGAAAADLRWWMWEPGAHAGDVEPGWVCRLAVEDPLDGLAWALNATDRLVETSTEGPGPDPLPSLP